MVHFNWSFRSVLPEVLYKSHMIQIVCLEPKCCIGLVLGFCTGVYYIQTDKNFRQSPCSLFVYDWQMYSGPYCRITTLSDSLFLVFTVGEELL